MIDYNIALNEKRKIGFLVVLALVVLFFCFMYKNNIIDLDNEKTISIEELCAQGKYQEAYKASDPAQAQDIHWESVIAVCSADAAELLKDPLSFELKRAYYTSTSVLVCFSGKNILGIDVNTYCLFEKKEGWKCTGGSTELSEVENAQNVMKNGTRLPEDAVKRINDMYYADILGSVKIVG